MADLGFKFKSNPWDSGNGFNLPTTTDNPVDYGFGTGSDGLGFKAPGAASAMANWGKSSNVGTTGIDPTSIGGAVSEWMKKNGLIDTIDKDGNKIQGWGGLATSALGGLGSAFMAMKQYGLAQDTLNFQKDAFAKNYAAQKTSINSQLEDRQKQRVAENPNAESVASYMNKYGVK